MTCASPSAGSRPSFRSTTAKAPEWNTDGLRADQTVIAQKLCTVEGRGSVRGPAPSRPGQMVSGRAPAALGFGLYWRRDGQPIWRGDLDRGGSTRDGARTALASCSGWPRGWASTAHSSCRPARILWRPSRPKAICRLGWFWIAHPSMIPTLGPLLPEPCPAGFRRSWPTSFRFAARSQARRGMGG